MGFNPEYFVKIYNDLSFYRRYIRGTQAVGVQSGPGFSWGKCISGGNFPGVPGRTLIRERGDIMEIRIRKILKNPDSGPFS